ncbi:DUF748 domain-containing protein [Rhodoferax sp.]|uniref:DUF748 domain-containing protein n=1 Tax=Rhodoferax sp. TaxID=50421 RepID=UPI00285261E8|nr:DUF748 domain-containing protein [Rhodoferax sp.]
MFEKPWLRRLIGALGSLLALWVITWLAVPPLLKSQAQSRLSELLGRQVTLGEVDFKPWTLELSVRDVAVARAHGADGAQLTIGRLYIDMELQSLLRLAPVADALKVESPHLNLTRISDGHYDVDDVLARLADKAGEPPIHASAPLRFAFYNLMLSDGAVELTDTPKGKQHHLSHLQVNVPFLSNLLSKRDVLIQPKLAFDLNGSQFDSSASTTPFAQTHKTDAQFVVKDLDLAPYLGYLPASLPVRLESAVLNADVKLAFEQADQTAVKLTGVVSASHVRLVEPHPGSPSAQAANPGSADLLTFDALSVQLKDVQPLSHHVQLGRVTLKQPHLSLQRNRAGILNVMSLAQSSSTHVAPKNVSDSQGRKGVGAQKDAPPISTAVEKVWQVQADDVDLQGGEVSWLDQSPAKPVALTLSALKLQAHALTWPFTQPMPFEGSAQIAAATLQFKGSATDQLANVSAQVADLPLNLAASYVDDYLNPHLDGQLKADLSLTWAAASATQASHTRLQLKSLSLDKFALTGDKKNALASIRQLQLGDVVADVGAHAVEFGSIKLTQPSVGVTRETNGRWMFEDWLKGNEAKPRSAASSGAASTTNNKKIHASADKPWLLTVKDLQVGEGVVTFADNLPIKPVHLDVSSLSLQLKKFTTKGKTPFAMTLAARVQHGHTDPGKVFWRGTGALSPLVVKGDLTAERLPMQAFAPYLLDILNVSLSRADTSFKGRINLAQQSQGMALHVTGDARLEDLQARTVSQAEPFIAAEDLLNWKSLSLTGLDVALAPGTATKVDVQGTVLSDFYARLILSETGRLNLQDVMKPATATVNTTLEASKNGASSPASAPANVASTAVAAAQPSDKANAALAPVIHFGPISLLGGRVNFTDHFIKPNYSADLTELVGKLSAFSSQTAAGDIQLADLELRGRAEGTATLEVLGKINPLVKPIALDIKGKVRDLELAPLSTYSARYAGYGIERGKLSVDVAYKVQPDGMLTASNKVVLNQLKFGDAVPGATNSLPVKLAVALLADRNGVIDVDLPISGSLNDPQFRLMPVVFRIIGNLIVKAVTAPFSLLANTLGGSGGDELSMVSFDAGSAVLSDQAKVGLDKVAKALQERPALKMTVVGTASLEVERDDYKRLQLQTLVQGEKRRSQPAGDSKDAASAPIAVSAEEYPALLRKVYRRGDFPKPRNLIGLTKDIPVPEMEALLLAHMDASESAMQALAVKRGVAVRDYLASLNLPPERLFLGAAKAVSPEAKWKPHAELSLATE